jgi:tetratricopeptide (TPR) repeat protein
VGGHLGSRDTGLRGFKGRHELALVYKAQGRGAEAEAEGQAALTEQPHFRPARMELGYLYLEQCRWPELEAAAAQLEQDPHTAVEGLLLRAKAHLARREFDAARGLVEAAIARAPRAVAPRVVLTHLLLQEGRDWHAAEQALREVLELDPGQAESWRNLAVLYRQQRRLAEAEAVCRSARVHCPADPDLLLLHGLTLRERGDVVGAETSLVRLLEIPPGGASEAARRCGTARHNLALIYHAQGRPVEAEVQWRAVLAEDPHHLSAWLGLADLCLEQGRWAELEQITSRLENGVHGPMEAAVLRARVHLARQEFAAARQLLEETIARHPRALWPRVLLSHTRLQEARDWPAAEQALRDVLALAPDHAEARRNLAILRREHGRPA